MTWPIIFLLVVLKIPIVYLCLVIWWAIRAEPKPESPSTLVPVDDPAPRGPAWRRAARRRPRVPHGPTRRPTAPRGAVRVYARR